MTPQDFINQIVPYVKEYAPKYGIKVVSPILGQAILESQYGNSELAVQAKNFFGLKYNPKQPDRCPSANGYYVKTGSEQNPDGSYVSSVMYWQKFSNYKTGIQGYYDFLFSKYAYGRYNNLKGITDPKKYLETIKADGYATSIKYVDNIMNVITKYNLTKYDVIEEQSQKFYRVNCGSFSSEENAKKLQSQLLAAGFQAIIKQYDGLFKVQVGAYSVRTNAVIMMNKLQAKGFNAFIIYC